MLKPEKKEWTILEQSRCSNGQSNQVAAVFPYSARSLKQPLSATGLGVCGIGTRGGGNPSEAAASSEEAEGRKGQAVWEREGASRCADLDAQRDWMGLHPAAELDPHDPGLHGDAQPGTCGDRLSAALGGEHLTFLQLRLDETCIKIFLFLYLEKQGWEQGFS